MNISAHYMYSQLSKALQCMLIILIMVNFCPIKFKFSFSCISVNDFEKVQKLSFYVALICFV